jgi:hypothetical protein
MVHETTTTIETEPTIKATIRKAQLEDGKLKEIRQLIKKNKTSVFTEADHGTLWFKGGYAFPILSLFGS